jgi:hypothetical protein
MIRPTVSVIIEDFRNRTTDRMLISQLELQRGLGGFVVNSNVIDKHPVKHMNFSEISLSKRKN